MGILLPVVLILSGCESWLPPEPTATRAIDDSPTLSVSPTVLPLMPTENESDSTIGRNNPTAAALAAEGQPTEDVTAEALPTQPTIPLTIYAADGVLLEGDFYGAPTPPAPVIVIVGENTAGMPELLQLNGYHVLVLTLRGDPSVADQDVIAAFNTLKALPNITTIAVLGIDTGATPTLRGCEQHPDCKAVAVVNPVTLRELPLMTTQKPLLVLSNENTSTVAQEFYNSAQGLRAFEIYNSDTLLSWLATQI